jgi:hypothetical protein
MSPGPKSSGSPGSVWTGRSPSGAGSAAWNRIGVFFAGKSWLIPTALVALGLFLRWTDELYAWFNPDEGLNYFIAVQPSLAGAWANLSHNAHPPLFSICLWWMSLFGADPTWLRIFSLVCGCAGIHGVWLLGRELGGGITGFVAAALIAISPAEIVLSQVIRPYALQLLCLSYGLYFLARWLRTRRGLLGLSVFMTAAVMTQFSSFLVAVGVGMLLAGMIATRRFNAGEIRGLALAFFPVVAAMALSFFLHVLPNLIGSQMQKNAMATWLSGYYIDGAPSAWFNLLGLLRFSFGQEIYGAMAIALALGLVIGIVRGKTIAILSAIVFCIALLASAAGQYPFGTTRHSSYLIIFMALVVGQGIAIPCTVSRRSATITFAAASLLLLFHSPLHRAMNSERIPQGLAAELPIPADQWQRVVPVLEELRTSEGLVITSMQAHYALFPAFHQRSPALPINRPTFRWFQWGKRDVIASMTWEMTILPELRNRDEHLYRLLADVTAARIAFHLGDYRRATLLSCGWSSRLADEFEAVDQQLPPEQQWIQKQFRIDGFAAHDLNMSTLVNFIAEFDAP